MSLSTPLGKVFWIDASACKIQSANLDGSDVQDVVAQLNNPLALAVDSAARKIYWVDAGTKKICRADLDGSNVEDLVTDLDSPAGSSLGLAAGKVYWIDRIEKKILRANHGGSGVLAGSDLEAVASELKNPNAIAVEPLTRKLYWGDFGTKKVHRANLDGSARESVVAYGRNSSGVAVDPLGAKIYWANFGTKCIFRCSLNGSDMEYIVSGLQNPNGITLDLKGRKVYWVDRDAKKIQRASLDGSDVEDVVVDLGSPWGVAVSPGPLPQAVESAAPAAPADVTLKVILPETAGPGMTMSFNPLITGDMLKQRLQYLVKALPEKQRLFVRASEAEDRRPVDDELKTLQAMGIESGATLEVEVVGDVFAPPARPSAAAVPEKSEAAATLPAEEAPEDAGLPVVSIERYQWADEDKNVKIYIDVAKEKGAVEAAGDGKNDEVVSDFRPTAFTLTVKGKDQLFVLKMKGLFREIVPEKCRFRVSAGKRITVTLAKREEEAWKGIATKSW